ncbi:hypothetical protein GCM10009712_33340 [Pseudarthrobacter sulfonivorans]
MPHVRDHHFVAAAFRITDNRTGREAFRISPAGNVAPGSTTRGSRSGHSGRTRGGRGRLCGGRSRGCSWLPAAAEEDAGSDSRCD